MRNNSTTAHHFETAEQQHETASIGMWAFLVTEVMFFGGVFAAYAVCRWMYPDAFHEASNRLSVILGAVNTAVLICSSLTMALAVRSAQLNRQKQLILFLLLTIVLGSAFLGIKVVEYSDKFEHHLFPGESFFFEGPEGASPNGKEAQLFFTFYFVMTGLHAVHMIIGIGVMAVLTVRAWEGRYSSDYYTPVEGAGLYWHFVDIVWIYLFPLLYLIGRA